MRSEVIWLIILLLACALPLAAQDPSEEEKIRKENPYTTAADIERGRHLFMGHCAPCHGPSGDGGRGANLARPKLPRAVDDQALFKLLKSGIDGTEMPAAWEMINREVWQVVAYVRTLGRVAPENVPGDAARGRDLFRNKAKCTQCHTVAGEGGAIGPELTEVGARRSAAYLRRALVEPEADLPDGFLQVRLVTKDGRRLTGVRLNEDTFSLQVRDLSDRLYSFWKTDLREIQKDRGKSPMPSYRGTLSDSEIDDVVAYLVSLRGSSS
jgi:cytochrome c oxidase cbb3-type subunit 3